MNIRALLLQVYYDLDEERRTADAKDVAICRVEQLCPFPYDLVQRELKRYPSTFNQSMGRYNNVSVELTFINAIFSIIFDFIFSVFFAPRVT